MTRALVLKLGGELLESPDQRARVANVAAALAADRPLVLVHGGGRAIDAELARRGIAPKKIDGLRVTDAGTLEAVVAVLAGSANTELVAALVGHGVAAVGLTGVDAGFGRASLASAHKTASGATVDLGFVGDPIQPDAALLTLLLAHGYVPVIASLGIDGATVLNVNADVMACRIAAALDRSDLIIAGTTPGVLDNHGASIAALDLDGIDAAIETGTASAGMVAKLLACRTALVAGVASIRIVDGRALDPSRALTSLPGTTLTESAVASAVSHS